MTLKQFNQFDEMEQAELLWKYEAIDFRTDETFKYLLYQIDGFYVEARFHIKYNLLTGLWAFDDTVALEPYLAQNTVTDGLLLPKRDTFSELTREALEVLPEQTIQQIRHFPEDRLHKLHFTIRMVIRTELTLWQRKVEDEKGLIVHPDDVSMAIIQQIYSNQHTAP
jgi:hypothetical protein